MPADVKEIFFNAEPLDPEHVAPDALDEALDIVARRDTWRICRQSRIVGRRQVSIMY